MTHYWVDKWTFKKNSIKNSKQIQKNHEVTRGTLLGWHVYILKKLK